jgi:hypothetical protein
MTTSGLSTDRRFFVDKKAATSEKARFTRGFSMGACGKACGECGKLMFISGFHNGVSINLCKLPPPAP